MDKQFMAPSSFGGRETGKGLTALVDADFIKYKVTYKIATRIPLGLEEQERNEMIIEIINEVLNYYVYCTEADRYIFVFSDKTKNLHRYHSALEREYKGKRTYEEKYEGEWSDLAFISGYLNHTLTTIKVPGMEADDVVSLMQRENTFIISEDKDLDQVPGIHYDLSPLRKGNDGFFYETGYNDAINCLVKQMITGDSTDNIVGVPGKGLAYFRDHVEPITSPFQKWSKVMSVYFEKYGPYKGIHHFVENFNLLAMRTMVGEFNNEKFGKLWTELSYSSTITKNSDGLDK